MKKYSVNETFTATQGQQTFSIEKPFISGNISVFLNGVLQVHGENKDYLTAQDTGKVIFQKPLDAGDTVSVVSNIASNRVNLEIVSPGRSDKPNALYKKYGTVERLKTNNKYEVVIGIGKDIVKWNFITRLTPMFATSRKIWEDIGEFIEGFTEEYISSMLYRNSCAVIELIDELAAQEDPVENVTYTIDENGNYKGSHSAVKDWVKYQTEIDLIMARYYGISFHYGTEHKEIGDISIERSTKLPYLDTLLNGLKSKWQDADNKIRGINVVAYGVKAINNYTYDNWARVTDF